MSHSSNNGYQFNTGGYNSSHIVTQKTLIDQSSADHPISLSHSNHVVSQIMTSTQNSPSRQSKTFVYRSESPIRSSSYGKNVINVQTIQKSEAPVFVSKSTVQNPIYVEKIVKVESSNTQELTLLRQRISVQDQLPTPFFRRRRSHPLPSLINLFSLETNNKTLTEELIELRNATPQQVEQIVYIENNEETNKLRLELDALLQRSQFENDNIKRSRRDSDNSLAILTQERDRLLIQIREISIKFSEMQSILPAKDAQIKNLTLQNENLAIRIVLTTTELERLVRERAETEPLKRKSVDLEQFLVVKERTIEELRGKLAQAEQQLSHFKSFEARCSQYESEINGLKSRVEELIRTIHQLQGALQQKDQDINKLSIQINQFSLTQRSMETLQSEFDQLRVAYNQRMADIEDLRRRNMEAEQLAQRAKVLEAKLTESEQNSLILIKRIEELTIQLRDEGQKRNRHQADLDAALRDRQTLEAKNQQLIQQIDFMTRKMQTQEQEIIALRGRLSELENSNRQLQTLESKISYLNQQIDSLNALLNEKEQALQKLNNEVTQLRFAASQNGNMQEEIRRLQEALQTRVNEIEGLRRKLSEYEQTIGDLRKFQNKTTELDNIINILRQRITELETALNQEAAHRQRLQDQLNSAERDRKPIEDKIHQLQQQIDYLNQKIAGNERQLQEKDTIIAQLRQELISLQMNLRQLSNAGDEAKRLAELLAQKTTEIDGLRRRNAELEQTFRDYNLIQSKLQECEKNNAMLRQRIGELEALLNEESMKKTRFQGDLDISLRDRQAIEEKLVHFTQQIEFLTRKTQLTEQENAAFRQLLAGILQILELWEQIVAKHSQFGNQLEVYSDKIKNILASSQVHTTMTTTTSKVQTNQQSEAQKSYYSNQYK